MNYEEAMNFIQNTSKFGSVLGLDNIKELLERLGNPQDQLKVVHIAGTNGKGSTLAFLAGIFRESGYRAGRYVSPASFCYEERFRINEENISKEDLCFYMEKIKKISEEMVRDGMSHPTMFEIETALSFLYFLDKKVDVVLLETGMGGRLDATNVVKKPIAVIIASIGMDHMQFLGDTIEKIAAEKAGIIKEGCPVISYNNQESVNEVIKEKAKEMQDLIYKIKGEGDTIGGVLTCVIKGCPIGLGQPIYGKLQSALAAGMLSINAAKAFEYGEGFKGLKMKGSEQNDVFFNNNGRIETHTNHSGGIQGGISNGQDIYFRVVFKPIATLLMEQETVNIDGVDTTLKARGRHDACVLPRAVPIVEAMAAMTILDYYLLDKTTQL
mgnify:CR=1 FL=1